MCEASCVADDDPVPRARRSCVRGRDPAVGHRLTVRLRALRCAGRGGGSRRSAGGRTRVGIESGRESRRGVGGRGARGRVGRDRGRPRPDRSLVADGKGGAYAGGDSKGRVFAVRAGGAVSTVFDASEDEVRALAVAPDGSLYAAALSSSSIVSDEPDSKDDDSDKVTPVTAPVSGSRAIVYRIVPDSSVTAVWTSPHPLVFALAALGGKGGPAKIVAGTGNRATLFALTPPGATQWLALPQGQGTPPAPHDKGRVYAATPHPGAPWRGGPRSADHRELQSGGVDPPRLPPV